MELDVVFFDVNIEDDGTGLQRTSLVDQPAIGRNFELFSDVTLQKFDKQADKQFITGPVMIPDLKMLRQYSGTDEYYYAVFSAKAILNTVKKASKENKFNELTLRHSKDGKDKVVSAFMIQSLILDDTNKPEKFNDLPNGTWIATWWIEDTDYWNDVIKSEEFKGFSVEVIVDMIPADEMTDEMLFNKIKKIINSDISDDSKEFIFKQIESIVNSDLPVIDKDILIRKLL